MYKKVLTKKLQFLKLFMLPKVPIPTSWNTDAYPVMITTHLTPVYISRVSINLQLLRLTPVSDAHPEVGTYLFPKYAV